MKSIFIVLLAITSWPGQHNSAINHKDNFNSNIQSSLSRDIIINGNLGTLVSNGTLRMRVWQNIICETAPDVTPYLEYLCKTKNGKFSFHFGDIDRPMYFSLYYFDKQYNKLVLVKDMNLYIAEPGDSINLTIANGHPYFSGLGSAKYNCRYRLDSIKLANIKASYKSNGKDILKQIKYNDTSFAINWVNRAKSQFSNSDSLLMKNLKLLKTYEARLSAFSYQLMKLDILSECLIKKLYAIKGTNSRIKNLHSLASTPVEAETVLSQLAGIKRLYYNTFNNSGINDVRYEIKGISKNYVEMLFMKTMQEQNYLNNSPIQEYYSFKNNFTGDLRDKLIARFFLEKFNEIKNANFLITDALSTVKNKDCKMVIGHLDNQEPRVKAFNFTLSNGENKMISLNQFEGKVVVLDFWFTGCPGCSVFYKNVLSPVENKFENNKHVIFISISVDYNRYQWQESVRKNIYTTDSCRNVINLYTNGNGVQGKVIRHYNIVTYPHPFIIDKHGFIFNSSYKDLHNLDTLTQVIYNALER